MAMSPRLLRPIASGVHPEAADWRARVVANGGAVSGSTLQAVSRLCTSISSAGIRDRFYRLNVFCGDNLNAALVPLYRGPTFGGTTYGNATDTNNGPFVSADYVETGTSGGLVNNGTKHLNTGLDVTDHGDSRHLSAFVCDPHAAVSRSFVGSDNNPDSGFYLNGIRTSGTDATSLGQFAFSSFLNSASANINTTGMHVLGVAIASGGAQALYRNATSVLTGTSVARTRVSGIPYYVFANNRKNVANDHMEARLGAYSIGDGMTATQVTAFYNAMLAFQNALGRKTT